MWPPTSSSGALPFTIQKAGTAIGTRRALNLIEGANVTLTVADDAGNDRVNVTVARVPRDRRQTHRPGSGDLAARPRLSASGLAS